MLETNYAAIMSGWLTSNMNGKVKVLTLTVLSNLRATL